jgi:hypothetical protein
MGLILENTGESKVQKNAYSMHGATKRPNIKPMAGFGRHGLG